MDKNLQLSILLSSFLFLIIHSTTATDKDALLELKSGLATSIALSSWDKTHPSPCNWSRISGNFQKRVVGINLSGLGLSGSITPSIANISFLRFFQIQGNHFKGPIPDKISHLSHLRVLNFSSNAFQGPIPANITHLRNLRILDLTANQITGRISFELSHLKLLTVLRLGKNLISGPIPSSLGNLSLLSEINFDTNLLTGVIPADLGRLRNLKQLDLSINNIVGEIPPPIYNMYSLVYLAVASNELWGKIPDDVGDTLPNLMGFNFCINRFTGTIPGSLHNLTNIRLIRMAHNLLEGTVPLGMWNLPQLRMYNIGFNKLVSSPMKGIGFLESLINSTRLSFLAIDANRFVGPIPESIGNLSKTLTHLYMGGNLISGPIPPSIGRLSSLALLNMSYNFISGNIPVEIGDLEELQELELAGNRIYGELPESLGNLQKLNHIDLSSNQLVGRIPTRFRNFQNMLSMDLSNNRINGSVPKETLSLPSLRTILNLSKNSLSGEIPQEIQKLQSVVEIDLSHNRFSGEIPLSIGNCKSIERLSMAMNLLSGSIPATLIGLKGLESLDLSSNKLSGTIPADLHKLKTLRSLNLYFNDLEGVVPVFSNFVKVQLEGNRKLCSKPGYPKNWRSTRRRLLVILIATIVAIILVALGWILVWQIFLKKSRAMGGIKPTQSIMGAHQTVSYNQLYMATSHFPEEYLIGRGSFGSVYKGYLGQDRIVASAIKVLDTAVTSSKKSFLAECEALRNIRHRNLVKVVTSCSSTDFENKDFLALVYEFMGGGNLEEWIDGRRRHANGECLNDKERVEIAADIACALEYLHHEGEAPVVHCDLKPTNILLDDCMTAKVGDFGLAKLLTKEDQHHHVTSTFGLRGSIGYIPPEYGLGVKPSTAGDVYSYGVMLLQLFTGRKPTDEKFVGGLTLKKWVESAELLQIVDPELLVLMAKPCHLRLSSEARRECVSSIIGVGLACTAHCSTDRITIRETLRRLVSARDAVWKTRVSTWKRRAG